MALVDIKEFRAETKTEAYAKATVQYGSNFMLLKEWQEKPKGPLGLFKKPEWVVRVMPIGSHNRKSESKSAVKEYSNNDNDLDSYEDKLISDEKELNKHKYTTETIDGSEMGERIVDMIKRLKEAQYIKKSEVQSTAQSDTNNEIQNNLNLSPNIQMNNSPEKIINERIMDEKINNDRIENFNNNNFNNRIKNNNLNNFNPLSSFNNSSLFGSSMLSDSYYNRRNSIDENVKKMVESQVKDIVKEYFENNVPNFNRNKNIENNNNNYYNRYESERSSINKTRYSRENREDFDFNNDIDDRRKDYRDDDRDNFENADAMEESFNYLRDREFPEETLLNLREYLLTSSNARFFQSNEIIREEIEKYFTNKLILSDGIDIGHKKKIIVFVGPTGVGKTTTIPKIAAQYIRSGRKVSFVTIDNYRIAAVDQLQRYASILKVPFTSASNPEALRAEIRKMDNSSLLFVDTMGRSPKGTDEIVSMSKYFSTVGRFDMDIQLVMSSTAKYKDSVKILEAFKPANYKGIILTKVDETDYLASSVCAITGTKTPITYITYGQGVPKDISTAKKYGIKIIESLYGNLK